MSPRPDPERISRRRFLPAAFVGGGLALGVAYQAGVSTEGVKDAGEASRRLSGAARERPDTEPSDHTGARVREEWLSFTDPRVGGEMNTGTDQSAKLQQWLTMAAADGRGVAFMPPGDVNTHRELQIPESAPRIVGAGNHATRIVCSVDLGPGKFVFKPHASKAVDIYMEHLWLYGPGESNGRPGSTVAKMDGMLVNTRCHIEHVKSERFRAGATITGDHIRMHDFDGRGNEYGLLWDNAETAGDNSIRYAELAGVSKASIGITTRGTISHALFEGCHLGGAPFAIHRFSVPGDVREHFILGVEFRYCGIENCANAVIFDEPQNGGISRLVFDPGGEWGTFAGPVWRGKPSRAWLDIGGDVFDSEWRVGHLTPQVGRVAIRARAIRDLRVDDPRIALGNVTGSPLRFADVGPSGGLVGITLGRPNGLQATCLRASEGIVRGDVCERVGQDGVRPARNSGPCVGVAVQPASSGDPVVVARGDTLLARASSAVRSGQLLKVASAHPGRVGPASSMADGLVIGNATEAISTGSSGDVHVFA